jgi:glycosyltransferase involved in cell wall biosynthesis
MAVIFINGLNAKAGGGKSILNNYLSLLAKTATNNFYYVLVPKKQEYLKYENNNIKVVEISKLFQSNLAYPFVYSYLLQKLIKKYKIEIVFNLADIPIKTYVKQVFLFDWAFASYPDSIVWDRMDFKSKIVRKSKLFFFKKYLPYVSKFLTQTENIKRRMESLYSISGIEVIPNAVSLENLAVKEYKNFNLPVGIKLLYLTHYYPHKNIEVFLELAKLIKEKNMNFIIVTTIDAVQHPNAKRFLDLVKTQGLDKIIYNIGAVTMPDVPSLYNQCDGLLMPTLLESFSGTYVEAMYHKIPIFTSNIDFATGVCLNGAVYFDPLNPQDILNKIVEVFNNNEQRELLISNAQNVLGSLPNWYQTFNLYNTCIEKSLSN